MDGSKYFTPFFNEETSSQSGAIESNELHIGETKQVNQTQKPNHTIQTVAQTWKWIPKKNPLEGNQKTLH